ncbi:DUF1127 domain-containing protein [Methylobacterium nodulans]|uniref:YjiS-like domain-containing protein n=1 Tax=Methylobacterium nodulans (strain LMG 21967 / CNCM I-2342 / ORS 2060) TaxID=460265 RepID=B8ILN0_METNO|nr:DUF1127 domain-containing protein [Methylobacterium nodulans]ACL62005.1 conserved hypothetical protein [Methylobacterium nodulans ORS 2060]
MTFGFAPLGVLSLVLRAGRVTGQGIAQAARLLSHRRAARRLAELDDRMLKDLGLTRCEVVGALTLPWRDDPTMHLADRRQARVPGASVRMKIVASDGRRVGPNLAV